jgi:Skp family chaperone for outer membrane proteins
MARSWLLLAALAAAVFAVAAAQADTDAQFDDFELPEDALADVQTQRHTEETSQIETLLNKMESKIRNELASLSKTYSKNLKSYEKAKGAMESAKGAMNSGNSRLNQELALIKKLREMLGGFRTGKKAVRSFAAAGLAGQLIVEAACIAMRPGNGWTFAVRRNCGSQYKTCAQVCASSRESQAGTLQCFNAIHMYQNQGSRSNHVSGLKTYRYNGCGGGCGPNYCCCSQKYRSSDLQESDDLADPADPEDVASDDDTMDEANDSVALTDVQGHLESSWNRYDAAGQILAQATCTAISGGHWSFAVRRNCGGQYRTCSQVCSGLTDSQAGRLSCHESLHLYANSPHNSANKPGLKVYRYRSCGGGCGPNYCCCRGTGSRSSDLAELDIPADVEETGSADDAVDLVSEDANRFDRHDLEGQTLAEATCTALNGGGWSFAVRRDCSSKLSCAQICGAVHENQVPRMRCYNSLHLYANNYANGAERTGLKTYKYNSCSNTGCGPNYCCCKQA